MWERYRPELHLHAAEASWLAEDNAPLEASELQFIESQRGTDKEILICKENIPLRIWYVNMNQHEKMGLFP